MHVSGSGRKTIILAISSESRYVCTAHSMTFIPVADWEFDSETVTAWLYELEVLQQALELPTFHMRGKLSNQQRYRWEKL